MGRRLILLRQGLVLLALWIPALAQQAPRITEPRDGAILNRHDGSAVADGLRITVSGQAPGSGSVLVNGVPATVKDGVFESQVTLRERETRIVAEGQAGAKHAVKVLWDRDSFPRYRFSVDDNIWFLRDIARNVDKYQSIFENPYLSMWRDMHEKYGTKVHFNIYYETDFFNLTQMPVKFREEWRRNSDWIRLSFHARANDPAKPYLNAPAAQIRTDYELVAREIERFAGSDLLGKVTTVHWGEATREGSRALHDEGIRVLAGYFIMQDGQPRVSYYLSPEQVAHAGARDYWKDYSEDLVFVRHDIVINNVPLKDIEPFLEKVAADPHQSEVMELLIHEQYFYPDYQNYEPDFRQRVERAIAWVTKRGYKPVFYGDGFLGAGKN